MSTETETAELNVGQDDPMVPMSDPTPTKWEQARRPAVELAAKLLVTPGDHDTLVVDCGPIMRSDLGVRYWILEPGDTPGTWSHHQSGETNHPLAEILQGIASAYTDRLAIEADQ